MQAALPSQPQRSLMACSCCRGATPRRTVCHHPLNPTLHGSELEDGARSSQVGTDTNPPMRAEKMTEQMTEL